MIGAAFAISVGLLIAVDDAVGRFVFAFVALVSVVQLWRLRRRYSSA